MTGAALRQQLENFIEHVDIEGLEYALTGYYGPKPEDIQHDAELAEAWKNAHDAIKRLDDLLTKRAAELGIERE